MLQEAENGSEGLPGPGNPAYIHNTHQAEEEVGGRVCIVPGSPLPGSYWLLMMWGYDVIKILGSMAYWCVLCCVV